jgi:hypothetical protein
MENLKRKVQLKLGTSIDEQVWEVCSFDKLNIRTVTVPIAVHFYTVIGKELLRGKSQQSTNGRVTESSAGANEEPTSVVAPISKEKVVTPTVKKSEDPLIRFFKVLHETVKYENEGGKKPKEDLFQIIKDHPFVLNEKCPEGVQDTSSDEFNEETYSAAEYLCHITKRTAGTRDLLYDLVQLGAIVTQKCYELIAEEELETNFAVVLLLSGVFPKDISVWDNIEGEYEDMAETIVQILSGKVKVDDHVGCGTITEADLQRLKNLPKLKAGVTHEKGGHFDQYLDSLKEDNNESDEEEDNEEEEEAQQSTRPQKKRKNGR